MASDSSQVSKPKRSRAGCLSCRRRHKKCDEIKPICKGCEQRGAYCEWPLKGIFKSKNVNSKKKQVDSFPTTNYHLLNEIAPVDAGAELGPSTAAAIGAVEDPFILNLGSGDSVGSSSPSIFSMGYSNVKSEDLGSPISEMEYKLCQESTNEDFLLESFRCASAPFIKTENSRSFNSVNSVLKSLMILSGVLNKNKGIAGDISDSKKYQYQQYLLSELEVVRNETVEIFDISSVPVTVPIKCFVEKLLPVFDIAGPTTVSEKLLTSIKNKSYDDPLYYAILALGSQVANNSSNETIHYYMAALDLLTKEIAVDSDVSGFLLSCLILFHLLTLTSSSHHYRRPLEALMALFNSFDVGKIDNDLFGLFCRFDIYFAFNYSDMNLIALESYKQKAETGCFELYYLAAQILTFVQNLSIENHHHQWTSLAMQLKSWHDNRSIMIQEVVAADDKGNMSLTIEPVIFASATATYLNQLYHGLEILLLQNQMWNEKDLNQLLNHAVQIVSATLNDGNDSSKCFSLGFNHLASNLLTKHSNRKSSNLLYNYDNKLVAKLLLKMDNDWPMKWKLLD